jgi:hypothetical protein
MPEILAELKGIRRALERHVELQEMDMDLTPEIRCPKCRGVVFNDASTMGDKPGERMACDSCGTVVTNG